MADLADVWADFYEAKAEAEAEAAAAGAADALVRRWADDVLTPCCAELWLTDRAQGQYVCSKCGLVNAMPVIEHVFSSVLQGRLFSSYKRAYHWNERIIQFLCMETPIPRAHMAAIKAAFAGVPARKVTKNAIRAVLRTLKWSTPYGEKWISIRCEVTGEAPPNPETVLLEFLRKIFPFMEAAFTAVCPEGRTSMISYNYLFVRALQFRNEHRFMKYFPLVKQKVKVRAISVIWGIMCGVQGWPEHPLPKPRFFQFGS